MSFVWPDTDLDLFPDERSLGSYPKQSTGKEDADYAFYRSVQKGGA